MVEVAVLARDTDDERALGESLQGLAHPVFVRDPEALAGLVTAKRVKAAIVRLWDRDQAALRVTLTGVRSGDQNLPILVAAQPTPARLEALAAIATSVAAVEFVLEPEETVGNLVATLLRSPLVPTAADALIRRLESLAPDVVRPFLLACLLKPSPRLRVETVARWLRVSSRTLRRRLGAAGWPGPDVLLGYGTALHAAWWLDIVGRPAKQVVDAMHFSHASALSRLLRVYANRTVTAFREPGGFELLLEHVERVLRGETQPRRHPKGA